MDATFSSRTKVAELRGPTGGHADIFGLEILGRATGEGRCVQRNATVVIQGRALERLVEKRRSGTAG